MANTYTQLNIHAVFAVQGRENILNATIRKRIFEYIHGTIKGLGLFPLAVNGYTDHLHIFFELNPSVTISKILQQVKSCSSRWINENHLLPGKFLWQEGYGAFSYSRSQRDRVIQYIIEQEKHHKRNTFKEEYLSFLRQFEIDYNEKYLFEFYD
ncbi:MAG: IS200/IS605 family transposase [Bacteroidales bacterium]|nr:IS200/IS605 family transposase [Bacteroidales bacterium]